MDRGKTDGIAWIAGLHPSTLLLVGSAMAFALESKPSEFSHHQAPPVKTAAVDEHLWAS
jgi:hypothetical protein